MPDLVTDDESEDYDPEDVPALTDEIRFIRYMDDMVMVNTGRIYVTNMADALSRHTQIRPMQTRRLRNFK